MPTPSKQLGLFDEAPSLSDLVLRETYRRILDDRRTAADVEGLVELFRAVRSAGHPVSFGRLLKLSGLEKATLARRLESLLSLELVELVPGDDDAVGYVVKVTPP